MSDTTPCLKVDFIDSIVDVTTCTDGELLEAALANTLYKLVDVDVVTISHIAYHYGEPEIHLRFDINPTNIRKPGLLSSRDIVPLREMPHFQKCFDTAATYVTFPDDNEEKTHCLHPILNRRDEVVGFLEIYGAPLPRADEHLLFGMLQIYRNYLRILEESEIDTLTGLLNRRTFDRKLIQMLTEPNTQEISDQSEAKTDKPKRRNPPVSEQNWMAVMDIDFFKKINDQYGHLYGDEVLILLANIMRKCFRHYDKLFRFGGEEFIIILKSTDAQGANQALSRFRKQVEQHEFPQVGKVTISIGYAEITKGGLPTQILGKADEALYYAKRNGRNQVCNYEALVTSGQIKCASVESSNDIELF
ncbi:MAG TPA: GGDEF domain-containing protein [Candidatus Tenderia sp.]|nr:GGDEF domain-containing protein [Candidatus Tenderia sp.]